MGGEKRAPWRSLTSLRRGLDAMFSQNIGDGALGPVANTDTKLLIYGLFQKGRVLAQDGGMLRAVDVGMLPALGIDAQLERGTLCLLFIHPRAPNLIGLRSAGTMPA